MKKLVLLVALFLTACGATSGKEGQPGGGISVTSGDALTTVTQTQPTEDAILLKLSTQGDIGGKLIGGIHFTLNLPPDVTLDATTDGQVAVGSVIASGVNVHPDYVMARYTSGHLEVAIMNSNGFPCGEFLTLTCKRTHGSTIAPTDFRIEGFQAADYSYTPSILPVDYTFTVSAI